MTEFSVALCVYDGDRLEYFGDALRSIVNQTCPPSEFVIVADGPVGASLDAALEEVSLNHSNTKIVRLKENVGHGEARRIGLENCTNELVALMDADDISLPDRFEKQLARFQRNPALSVVGGAIEEFQNVEGVARGLNIRKLPEYDADIRAMLKWRCPINQPTVMFRKSSVQAAGGYLDWFCNEDYYLWIRMALNGSVFENIPDVVLQFRVDESTYRRRGGRKYFVSEMKLQYYIYKNGLSNLLLLFWNVGIRFGAQILCPPRLRRALYTRIFRSATDVGGVQS